MYDKNAGRILEFLKGAGSRFKRKAASVIKEVPVSPADKVYNRWVKEATPEAIEAARKGMSTGALMGIGAAVPVAGYSAYLAGDAYNTNKRKDDLMKKVPILIGAAGLGALAGAGIEHGVNKRREAVKQSAINYLEALDKLSGVSNLAGLAAGAAAGGAGVYALRNLRPVRELREKVDAGKPVLDFAEKYTPHAMMLAGLAGAGLGAAGGYYTRQFIKRRKGLAAQADPEYADNQYYGGAY